MIIQTENITNLILRNPNDLKQVDDTKNKEYFLRNIDGSWKVDKGTTRIDIFTKQAGVLT